MKNNRKKVMILTNHSYMLYRFRKELIEELMKNYDVVLSMPFVGHHEDFINMGLRCIETKMERRGVNPIHDFSLMKFYKKPIVPEPAFPHSSSSLRGRNTPPCRLRKAPRSTAIPRSPQEDCASSVR